ncbi:DUF58 domain-containing protein [Candidatus Formimonas warabiya]|uniref:DUF58 domain-containing protein n=1 Tax=Formimonas warabiya TaxID=1761012 RepID=A0A3G1KS99_FORW1|nr:DUF58 domain-containing protein [Candidatus Formimonas warabiya]ATW25372.1 hypothetical protein DCMF_11865 [Candidatus Formimonas warabiya]
MMLSPRGLAVIFGGLFILIFGSEAWFFPAWIIYGGAVTGLFLLDRRMMASPKQILVEREYPDRFPIGQETWITLLFENHSSHQLKIKIKDDFPLELTGERKPVPAVLFPRRSTQVTYSLMPYKRGKFSFGRVNIRYSSPLGLFYRQAHYSPANEKVKVYPSLLSGEEHLLKIKNGSWQKEQLRQRHLLTGTEFYGIREYETGDEFRKINWHATARMGRFMTNEFREDRSQPVYFLFDAGRMMTETMGRLSKLDYAVNAGAVLAYVALQRGEQVGMVGFSDRMLCFVRAQKGEKQFQVLLDGMYQLQAELVEANYRELWKQFLLGQKKRSLICLFTDLVDPEVSRELVQNLSRLARKHLVLCLSLRDQGLGEKARVFPAEPRDVYEKAVAVELMGAREKAVAALRAVGVVVVDETPEKLTAAAVNKYLDLKGQMRL